MNALKSIKNRLVEYKDNFIKYNHTEKHNKKSAYYVPVIGTPLIFGFQMEAFPFKLNALTNDSWVISMRPRIKNYFFQFFIPNSLLLKPEYTPIIGTQLLYYYPVPRDPKFEQQDAEERCVEVYYTYPISYTYPAVPLQYDPTYLSKQRLTKLISEESKVILNSDQTLIFNFIKATKPTISTPAATLSDIWETFKVVSDEEVELFKLNDGNKPKMAVYSASLAGLHLFTNEKTIINYIETSPYYTRLPLYNKIQELKKDCAEMNSEEVSKLSAKAWLGILWTPISCVPQLRIQGQFLTFYEFSAGCKQFGMICYNLDECEFWKDTLREEETLKIIKEEKRKAKRFFGESVQLHKLIHDPIL